MNQTKTSNSQDRQVVTSFNASNLAKSDFAGVTAHNGQFKSSSLSGSDFSGADLTGSSFKSSDVHGAHFDGTNLTDCNLSTLDLAMQASIKRSLCAPTSVSRGWPEQHSWMPS
ncbi:pentapeptide repeat protein [Paenibacillus lactis 154]|uniref:Pentapeptide repeat protein n=1 Tax=Paenibacillus lactis 154 TaxID=743719 RepID=G4HMZ9_9BACL|nr:pentapeptide repeat protein [Paenibacillus lactis 154]